MSKKYGVFGEPTSYLLAGDPYTKEPANDTRDKGLSFKATIGKIGKHNDSTFDKFKSVHEGDTYIDPIKRDRQARNELRKKNVAEVPFKTVSPMKQSSGPGDFYGTVGGKVPYVPGATITVQKKKGEIPDTPKNFYTNPGKKGTYGMIKTTISERQGVKGVANEYEYHANPLDLEHQRRLEEKEAQRKLNVTELPFRPANPPTSGGPGVPNRTISKGKGVAGEFEYILGADAKMPGDTPIEAPKEAGVPFKPSSTYSKHMGKILEYVHDPEVPRLEKEAAARKAERERLAQSGPWKPNLSERSDMTRSVFRMNLKG